MNKSLDRMVNHRIKAETKRLQLAQEALDGHQLALTDSSLSVGKQMHHRVCIQFRERDANNAQAALDALAKVEELSDYRAVLDLIGRLMADGEAERLIFYNGYLWAMNEYLRLGMPGHAGKMRKQAEHWSKSYPVEESSYDQK